MIQGQPEGSLSMAGGNSNICMRPDASVVVVAFCQWLNDDKTEVGCVLTPQ